jgi:hypothetical protein
VMSWCTQLWGMTVPANSAQERTPAAQARHGAAQRQVRYAGPDGHSKRA